MRRCRHARVALSLVIAACANERVVRDQADAGQLDTSTDSTMPTVNNVEDCFVGAMFAECPGPDDPKIYCTEHADCLWVSNGLPLGDYNLPLRDDCRVACSDDPHVLCASGAWFMMIWGDGPWTRTREMNLAVVFDAGLEGAAPGISACSGDPLGYCTHRATGAHVMSSYGIRDTEVARFVLSDLHPKGIMLEIDHASTPPRARACVWKGTDLMDCLPRPIACAEAGTVILGYAPVKGQAPPPCTFVTVFAQGRIEGGCGAPTVPRATGPAITARCVTIEHQASRPDLCGIVARSCEVDSEGGWAFQANVAHPGPDDDHDALIPRTTCGVFPNGVGDGARATEASYSATEQDLQRACGSVEDAVALLNAKCGWAITAVEAP